MFVDVKINVMELILILVVATQHNFIYEFKKAIANQVDTQSYKLDKTHETGKHTNGAFSLFINIYTKKIKKKILELCFIFNVYQLETVTYYCWSKF